MPRAATASRKKEVAEPTDKPARAVRKSAKKSKEAAAVKPKRALSAYMFFSQAKRNEVKDNNPNATFGEIGKLLGKMWSELTEEQKKPYKEKSDADKARYEAERAAVAAN
ncbi:Non-histone chromosomal protein 6 [Coemansia sp. RSA 989]|nr:high mobility group box-domain-containing protein [Coemansia mojavensis]KAJ1744084.1 Non-histone chromosomal protein 6 [Coemansia sp. RSA 1086]KAJ1752639.1 Non-histone chromosomal protein 6 [Coemansia sp. RSA 1821]KAJ1867838.1 Non-histone chromosomal protein 6 [Coemansia sp. RSA 989]KAJ1874673.1 Non-histone chromosomal protein 6 [Coemansia sp. RSA 990]KAJ2651300.1 Non-histone chromosomal protein 6 [Coemansia sp. RSA 1250]KAJ2673720.1 Non-histone chromosomal protein 6 [Coemansia sp. RSA 108